MSVLSFQDFLRDLFSEEKIYKNEVLHIENCEIQLLSFAALDLIDTDLLNEIKAIVCTGNDSIYFGKTLRDIKCVIRENDVREHEVFVKYVAPKKLVISSVNLPYSPLQDREFKNIEEILTAYQSYVNALSAYFYELDRIDRFCTVMEPHNPTFKDDYRRVLLDGRTWLHVEVTPKGCATNIHLVGHSELWHGKLQSGLLSWDHDKDIVENIMLVFDIAEFSVTSHKPSESERNLTEQAEMSTCGICLCVELPDYVGLPQPLCQNPTCGVYFHRNCLYQWLVACAGSRPPAIGVATGACPTCLKPIACSEKDS